MKAFSDKGNLTAHQFLHSGEKHHVCPMCSQVLTRNSSLERHIMKNRLRTEQLSSVKESAQE